MTHASLKIEKGQVTLCCGGKRCPVVRVDGDRVRINDDDGNEITISKEHASLIHEAVQAVAGQSELTAKTLPMHEQSER